MTTTLPTLRLTGLDAIAYHDSCARVTLITHSTSRDGWGPVSRDNAVEITEADPSLIYVDVPDYGRLLLVEVPHQGAAASYEYRSEAHLRREMDDELARRDESYDTDGLSGRDLADIVGEDLSQLHVMTIAQAARMLYDGIDDTATRDLVSQWIERIWTE